MRRKINTIITAALAAILAAMSLCACSTDSSDDTNAVKKNSETQATAAAATPAAKAAERQQLIYSDFNHEGVMPDIAFTEDFDGDGAEETVTLSRLIGEWDDSYFVNIKVNSQTVNTSASTQSGYTVAAVYLVDLDTSDDAKEIGVMLIGEDDYCWLELFRLNNGILTPMKYEYKDRYNAIYYSTQISAADNVENSFVVNNDGTFTMISPTSSYGMWNISVDYEVGSSGYIVEVPQDYYSVVDIEDCHFTDDDGYALVNKTLTGRGFDLYAGDRITVLRDDGKNNLLLEKSTGETGWFKIGDSEYDLYEVSELFMVAG